MYACMSMCVLMYSGRSRNFEKGFPLAIGPRRGDLGTQPPAAEDALVFISIRYNKNLTFFLWTIPSSD